MILKKVKNNYILIIIGILAISFLMTIYVSWENLQYKNRIGELSFEYTEKIKGKNYSNLDIIQKTLKLGEINNTEILKVIDNCSRIDEALTDLNDDYYFYREKSISIFTKGSNNKEESLKNNFYKRSSELFYQVLQDNMNSNKIMVKLSPELENDLKIILSLSTEIDEYYKKFETENLHNVNEEEKQGKVVKKSLWIDILEDIEEITIKYNDAEFKTLQAKIKK